MSDRRKNTRDRRHHNERRHNEHIPSERRQQRDRRLAERSSHAPNEREAWRLEGRQAKEDMPLSKKLHAVAPEAWTYGDHGGHHCVVGPFSSLERAKAFSQKPRQQRDYETYFFQLRTVREYWFVEVSPAGNTRLISSSELVSEVVYEEVF